MYVSQKSSKHFSSLVTCCCFHDNGIIYAAGGADGTVQIYAGVRNKDENQDTFAGACSFSKDVTVLHTLHLSRAKINSLLFIGDVLYVACGDANIYKVTFKD